MKRIRIKKTERESKDKKKMRENNKRTERGKKIIKMRKKTKRKEWGNLKIISKLYKDNKRE